MSGKELQPHEQRVAGELPILSGQYAKDQVQIYGGDKYQLAVPMTQKQYEELKGWDVLASPDTNDRDGYLAIGAKLFSHTWMPKDEFEKLYRFNGSLTFGDALAALKQGQKVARSGWNGKDQYVAAQAQKTTTEASKIWNPHNKAHAEKIGGQIDVAPYCTLKTAQDTLAMGWVPSTGDLFANDWIIIT